MHVILIMQNVFVSCVMFGLSMHSAQPPRLSKVYQHLCMLRMKISLADEKVVSASSPELKSKWRIGVENQILVDDELYVKVDNASYTLRRFISEDNDDAKGIDVKSLQQVKGYFKLLELRASAKIHAEDEGGSTLFSSSAKQKKARISHSEKKSIRHSSTIDVDIGDNKHITVLVHVHPTDAIWVQYTEENIQNLIEFLRSNGFQQQDGPKVARSGNGGKRKMGAKCRRRSLRKSESSGAYDAGEDVIGNGEDEAEGNEAQETHEIEDEERAVSAEEAVELSQASSLDCDVADVASCDVQTSLSDDMSDNYEASQQEGT